MSSHQGISVCTCYHHFILQCGATQIGPGWGESSGVTPGGGGGKEEEFSARQNATIGDLAAALWEKKGGYGDKLRNDP